MVKPSPTWPNSAKWSRLPCKVFRKRKGCPMLTFVKIEVGWIDSAVKIDEVWAAWPKEMDRLLRRPGTLGHEARARIAERLATTLRPA